MEGQGRISSKATSKKKKRRYYGSVAKKDGAEDTSGDKTGSVRGEKRRKSSSSVNSLVGFKGFLVTCDIGRDRRAARQMEQAIREVVDTGKQAKSCEKGDSVADSIAQELKDSKETGLQVRFQDLESRRGFFLATLDNAGDFDTVNIATTIVREVMLNKKSVAPECIQLVPLQAFCPSNIEDIKTALTPLISSALKAKNAQDATFAIHFKRRFSETPKRSEVLSETAPFVQAIGARDGTKLTVDLGTADFTIIIEVYKSIAGISVVRCFKELKCFNLRKAGST